MGPDQIAERLPRLKAYVERAGRRFSDVLLTVRTGRAAPVTRDVSARYDALGVRLLVVDPDYRRLSLDEALGRLEALARELRLEALSI